MEVNRKFIDNSERYKIKQVSETHNDKLENWMLAVNEMFPLTGERTDG